MAEAGDVPPKFLVVLTPQVLLAALVVIPIIIAIFVVFLAEETTPARQDFDRFTDEVEAALKIKLTGQPESINVPLHAEGYSIAVFPEAHGMSPDKCKGKTCICLYETGDPKCVTFSKIHANCAFKKEECGEHICIDDYRVYKITKQGQNIPITRTCNKLSFS